MSPRIRIASSIWFVTALLAVIAVFLSSSFLVPNISGHGQVSVVPFLILPLVPPLVAAVATMLMADYAARASSNGIFAGPTVVGCCAGFAAAVLLGADRARALAVVAAGILSLAGAVAGTFVHWPAPPWMVGIAIGIMTLLVAFLAS